MGGSSGKSGATTTGSGSTAALNEIAQGLFKETDPTRKELLTQGMNILKGGGVGTNIPLVQEAVASSKSATSQTLKEAADSLAKSGLSGTPYGESTLTGLNLKGNEAANTAGTDVVKWFMNMLPGLVTGTTSSATSGLSSAAGSEAATTSSANSADAAKGTTQLGFMNKALFG